MPWGITEKQLLNRTGKIIQEQLEYDLKQLNVVQKQYANLSDVVDQLLSRALDIYHSEYRFESIYDDGTIRIVVGFDLGIGDSTTYIQKIHRMAERIVETICSRYPKRILVPTTDAIEYRILVWLREHVDEIPNSPLERWVRNELIEANKALDDDRI